MIRVKVHPKSRQEKVITLGADDLEVWTHAAPDKGAANDAVARLLARHLGVAVGTVRLVRGATARIKYFEISAG